MTLGFPITKVAAVQRQWTRLSVASSDARTKARRAADIRCDGTADQDDLMTAVAALAAGGGRIDLAGNLFSLSAPLAYEKDSVTIVGEGPGSESGAASILGTTLRAASGFSGSQVVRIKRADDTRPVRNCRLVDFSIDGNTQGIDGAHLYAYESDFENIWAARCVNGLYPQAYAGWSTYNTILRFCRAYENTGSGFLIGTNGTDLHFYGCQGHNNLHSMRWIGGTASLVVGGHFYTPTQHNLFFDGYGGDTQLTGGLRLEGAGRHNILIDTTTAANVNAIQIKGIRIRNASTSATGTYNNIHTSGAGSFSSLYVGQCHILADTDTATDPSYGVVLASTCQNATIIDNHFSAASAYTTGTLLNNTTGSTQAFIRRNKGVRDQGWGGTATIASGATTAAITWPTTLDYTPDASQIAWTIANLATNAPGEVRLVSITTTGATFGCRSDPGASGLNISWRLNNK